MELSKCDEQLCPLTVYMKKNDYVKVPTRDVEVYFFHFFYLFIYLFIYFFISESHGLVVKVCYKKTEIRDFYMLFT